MFLVFLLAGAANLATGGTALFTKLTVFLVATVPVLVLLGLVRAVALLRRGTGASWRDAIGAFFIWQSTSLVVARASMLGLFARRPRSCARRRPARRRDGGRRCGRTGPNRRWRCSACSASPAALSKATELAGPLLAGLLLFPTLGMAAAPFNSWAAQRAALPPDLGRGALGVEAAPRSARHSCAARRSAGWSPCSA